MKKLIVVIVIVSLAGCRDKFDLPLRETDLSLLVVEGVLNPGTGGTIISLSRTTKLSDGNARKPVLRARLSVEGKNGGVYTLNETGNGNYTHSQLQLVVGQEYRLRILTDNQSYLSDYVTARKSPDIDSVSWNRHPEGVTIYVHSHDASNNTRYYKWDYEETWEIRSMFVSNWRWAGGTTILYSPLYHHVCWKYDRSKQVLIASTAQLQSDVVSRAPLLTIPFMSEKIGVRYSLLVKQQALTQDAYEFYKMMRSNTESIGSIFDPQPSELKTNIRCLSDPAEPVVGYLNASTLAEKRIFITYFDADWRYRMDCETDTIPNNPESIRQRVPAFLPFEAAIASSGAVEAYYIAPANCVDCTTRGGDLTRPFYW